jgi:hypothetical protein
MRIFLSIARLSSAALSGAVRDATRVVVDHVLRASSFAGAKKEKPGGGNAGLDIFVIGVYGFKYAAWLSFMPPESGEAVCFSCPADFFLLLLFSCSSITFLNLTEAFANSHRFLSVCALTRPWVGTTLY